MGYGLGIPAFGQHAHGNDVLYLLARLSRLPHGVHHPSEALSPLVRGELLGRPSIPGFVFIVCYGLGYRLLGFLSLPERAGINVQGPCRIAELINQDAPAVKGVLDPRRRFRYGWRR